jgi:hypothetical protein
MTLGKSLLLGSAAAMCAVFGAQAADLPVRKAAPVDYVRVCDFTGAGFFYIPGTDTCMQVGGILRTEFDFINNSRAFFPQAVTGTGTGSTNNTNRLATIPAGTLIPGRDRDETGFFARARLSIDTRTQTAYGQLRAFLQFQADRLQGIYSGGGPNGGANSFANQGGNNVVLRRGFIQFAGITAGRVQSFFDFYADNYNYEGIAGSDLNQDVFAYTYTFGGGLSSTLSFEDRTGRNLPQNLGNILGGPSALVSAARYAGETIPDIVGVLRYDQPWGAAQLSAAYHEIQSTEGPFAGTGNQGIGTADTNGFAVQGGVRIKLPMLAAGDDLWLEGTYQQGAYFYQDSGTFLNGGFSSLAVGGFQHIDRDAIAIHTPGTSAASYSLQKGEGFSALAAFNHYFTPNFHDVLFGSYEQTTYGRAKNIDWTLGGLGDGSEYRVGNQFLWDPVKNLEFGLEFTYMHIDQTLAHNPGQAATSIAGLKGVAQNPDAFEVRLRAERDF